jgi:hypothetical protein
MPTLLYKISCVFQALKLANETQIKRPQGLS